MTVEGLSSDGLGSISMGTGEPPWGVPPTFVIHCDAANIHPGVQQHLQTALLHDASSMR